MAPSDNNMDDNSQDKLHSMYPITPECFWGMFVRHFRDAWFDEAKKLKTVWQDAKSWTAFMTSLLVDMGKDLNCHVAFEYLRIDVGYFNVPAADWENWALEAAIEIENNVNWTEEIAKLMMINAGLKVLIAYDEPGTIQKRLDEFLAIRESRKYLTANDTWLFIFGPRILNTNQDFTALKYDGQFITTITGENKILSHVPSLKAC